MDEERSLQKKCGYTRRIVHRILNVAAGIKTREHQLRRTVRDLRTGVAECTEVDGGIFDHIL